MVFRCHFTFYEPVPSSYLGQLINFCHNSLTGPPSIVSHRTQFGIEGDNVRVECTAFSIPAPERVVWTFNGREVDLHDQDYSILEDPLPEGIKSTLIIRESQERHFGMYNCSVSNPYGSDVVEINLMPQSE